MRRDVRELEPAGDVPGGEDVSAARPAAPVDTDVAPLELDAELGQAETSDGGAAACRDEERVATYPFMLKRELDLAALFPGGDGSGAEQELDALRLERLLDERARFGLVVRSRRSRSSTTVTRLPSRWNACASSSPIEPPPRTSSRCGSSARSNTVRLVRYATASSPSSGGSAGSLPVAITNRSACTLASPT